MGKERGRRRRRKEGQGIGDREEWEKGDIVEREGEKGQKKKGLRKTTGKKYRETQRKTGGRRERRRDM